MKSMEKSKYGNQIFSCRSGIFILVLVLLLLIFFSYNNYLNHYFIDADTFSLIETARISSPSDFLKILKNPLMFGTYFIESAKYYRPLSALSFSLDYALWKLNPIGYNLTNLLLHILVSILVFTLARQFVKGNIWIPFLGAFIFSIHPVLLENIMHIPFRQDILASFFLLLSFMLFQNHQKMKKPILSISFSLLFYIFALGSKEFAVIFPFIISSYLFLLQKDIPNPQKFKIFSLYFLLSIMFIVLRTIILNGLGGINTTFELDRAILRFFYTTGNFFSDFLYPVHFLRKLFMPEPSVLEKCISLIILALLMATWGWFLKKTLIYTKSKTIKRITLILLLILIVNTLSMFLFPFYSHYFYNELHDAYFGSSHSFLSPFIKGKNLFPYIHYINLWSEFFFSFFLTLLTFLSIMFTLIYKYNKLRNLAKNSTDFRVSVFLIIWLTLPLLLYLLTFSFTHRTMYFSIIPFSFILTYLLSKNIIKLNDYFKQWSSQILATNIKLLLNNKNFYTTLLSLSLYLSLIYFSPLFHKYDGWRKSGEFYRKFFTTLSIKYKSLPENGSIEIHDLPKAVSSLKRDFPYTVEWPIIYRNTIKSWLNLHFPDNQIQVNKIKYIDLPSIPKDIVLKVERKDNNNAIIVVQYKF